jgi:hypothetical protein
VDVELLTLGGVGRAALHGVVGHKQHVLALHIQREADTVLVVSRFLMVCYAFFSLLHASI